MIARTHPVAAAIKSIAETLAKGAETVLIDGSIKYSFDLTASATPESSSPKPNCCTEISAMPQTTFSTTASFRTVFYLALRV